MHLKALCFSLFIFVVVASTAAVPPRIDGQRNSGEEAIQAALPIIPIDNRPTDWQLNSGGPSTYADQKSDLVPHGLDHHEKLISLCEAGFVADCRQAIEEETAAAIFASRVHNHDPRVRKTALLTENDYPCDGYEESFMFWGLVAGIFSVISIAVICKATSVLNSGKYHLIVPNEKNFR